MVRKNLKKEIHQPDDRFFKVVMSEEGSAAQYLTTYYPESRRQLLDISSLELQPDKFPIPDLKVFDADISYRCRFKNSEEQLMVSILWRIPIRCLTMRYIYSGNILSVEKRHGSHGEQT